ncbi:DUF4224 domain-containing protein [Pseudomonas knackmussii]|uniref:DUF4224 domain-containing protein n=1 Tax=Pseudomonas knackmussii TaxID=65741 RepID=UPI000A07ADD3|nr:DUF4224 domain-containing protein [Pseudomonas knackmussii]
MVFLSEAELQTLSGKQKPSAQARWLRAEKIPHMIGGDGKPKVLREKVLERLGGTVATEQAPQLQWAS